MDKKILYCYFCGAQEKEVTYLIEGDDAYICDYCVEKANWQNMSASGVSVAVKNSQLSQISSSR